MQHPRHARVNTLKASVQEVLVQLQQQQHSTPGRKPAAAVTKSSHGSGSSKTAGVSVHVDELLPDLLVFPPGTDLHDHPLVTEGVLILQVGRWN